MKEEGDADSESGVVRNAIEHYAQAKGYVNGHQKQTPVRVACREASKVAGVAGMVSLAFFAATPFTAGRYIGLLGLFIAFGLSMADRALANVEPAVTKGLKGVVHRE